MQSKLYAFLIASLILTTITHSTESSSVRSDSKSWEVDVTLRSQIYLPTPRPVQDVFVALNNSTPNLVYRVEYNQANDPIILEKEVYAAADATPHDPYKITPNPLGPFSRGEGLGFTLGEWLAAIGKGTYTEENGNATIKLTFEKLVPNGTYTVWYTRVTMPPNFKEILAPIGADDGSENVFKANAKGEGIFDLKIKALPSSTNVTYNDYVAMYVTKKAPISANITWTLISVAYTSEGRTHGAAIGELGKTTHMQMVHLMYPKPARNYEEWKNIATVAASDSIKTAPINAEAKQPGFEGFFAIASFLTIARLAMRKAR